MPVAWGERRSGRLGSDKLPRVERKRTSEELDSLVGATLGGRFLVRRVLGSGGMGAVYEVEHVVTQRTGALKLLHATYAAVPAVVERFVREASAAGRIENPHIVETFDAGELPSGEPYIFMELLRGSPVSALIATRGRLQLEEAREIVAQAAAGLAAAHARGIVHRDVKPDNLFLCSGPVPLVKIVDFGVSKFEPKLDERRLTTEGAPLGTPQYMSPEQVVGQRDIDFRTDIYALGVVLYECLTGEVPFRAETLTALGVKIFEGRYTLASELVPGLPEAVDAVIASAMAPAPRERFGDMHAFRAALLELSARPAPALGPTIVSPVALRRAAALDNGTAPGVASLTEPALPSDMASGDPPSEAPLPKTPTESPHAEPVRAVSGEQVANASAAAMPPPRRRRLSALVAMALVAATGALVLRGALSRDPALGSPTPSQDAEASSPVSRGPAPAPSVTAKAPAAVPAPEASAATAAAVPAISAPGAKASGRSKLKPPATPSSRVARDGLGVENPFK
jgi:serine/threonine protein kinase